MKLLKVLNILWTVSYESLLILGAISVISSHFENMLAHHSIELSVPFLSRMNCSSPDGDISCSERGRVNLGNDTLLDFAFGGEQKDVMFFVVNEPTGDTMIRKWTPSSSDDIEIPRGDHFR